MWPAGGPGTTVRVDQLGTGSVAVRRIPGIAPGDFPDQIVPLGRRLIYDGDDGMISVIADDHLSATAHPQLLGAASWFVPSVGGRVLLVNEDKYGFPVSARPVTVSTGARGAAITLPRGTGELIEGTARGLLLLRLTAPHRSDGGILELWRPRRRPRRLAYLPDGVSDAGPRLLDYGSDCRWRTARFAKGPSGYRVCERLHVLDLRDGRRFAFSTPTGTLGWLASQFSLDSGFAPDRLLAAQAAIAPARTGRAHLFLLRLNPTTHTTRVPQSTAPLYARSAWSRRGSWLLYQGPRERLRAFRLPGQTVALNARCCEYTALVSTPSSSSTPRHALRRSATAPARSTRAAWSRWRARADTGTFRVAAGATVKRFGLSEPAGAVRLLRLVAPQRTRVKITATIPGIASVSIAAPRPSSDPSESCRQRGRVELCTQAVEACPMPPATWRVRLRKLAGPAAKLRFEFIVG
ncbi:MAG: hypothetical protein ACRDNJ_10160 [Solirubrobacteraceae bacterium]